MAVGIKIRCRDLGVDHDSFVSGTSLVDLVDCVRQEMRERGVPDGSPQADRLRG